MLYLRESIVKSINQHHLTLLKCYDKIIIKRRLFLLCVQESTRRRSKVVNLTTLKTTREIGKQPVVGILRMPRMNVLLLHCSCMLLQV